MWCLVQQGQDEVQIWLWVPFVTLLARARTLEWVITCGSTLH
jgi:hypothetical protein